MNYEKIYQNLIQRGLSRESFDGCDKHRVIAGYEGGEYIEGNIAYLTRREHRIVHALRWILFNRWEDFQAARVLGQRNYKGPWNKGKKTGPLAEEVKNKLRDMNLGSYEQRYGPEKALEMRRIRSEKFKETRSRIDPWNKGKKCPSLCENRPPLSDEHKAKLSDRKKGRKWWNNGIETKMAHEQPAQDWVRGRL
jgi:hypothetical protein